MVLGSETLGRCLGREGRTFMNGISILRKGIPESSLDPPTTCGRSMKVLLTNQELDLHPPPIKSAGMII